MDAVVLQAPHTISVEKRPKPIILEPTDAVVKVIVAGICGSELHPYRGHQKTTFGYIMGHEFTGMVQEVGNEVKHFATGQRVIGTFSTACLALGTQQINGAQAQFVRVPDADGTLLLAPADMEDELLVVMSDIYPTGYYGAMRAIEYFQQPRDQVSTRSGSNGVKPSGRFFEKQPLSTAVFVCIGCGIVGLCGILTASVKGVGTVFCVDSVDDRLEQGARMGGTPLKLGKDDIRGAVLAATDGRGADAVIESVGNQAALGSAFDLLQPCGVLSSVGFHQGELPFSTLECYRKNLNINLGRAPVRAVFEEALEVFVANKEKFSEVISHRLPMSEAAQGYALFDTQQARKVVLKP